MHTLKLFRRHKKDCIKGYAKDLRIFPHDSLKATGRAQCTCTIVAQGSLPNGEFLKHQSTGENAWTKASETAELWCEWGSTTPPAAVVHAIEAAADKKAKPLAEAIEEFLTKKKNENRSPAVIAHHRQLFRNRLLEFAKDQYAFIQEMDGTKPWSDFRNSWQNMNPLHNKKSQAPMPVLAVSPGTAKRFLGQVREFIRFCISNGWITKEWAADEHLKVSTKVEPKEPFTDQDVQSILDTTTFVTDRGKTGNQNAKELLVFVYVLRYAGLRISDVTKLGISNLVRRPGEPENYSLHVYMQKTKKWVFVPIPSGQNDIPGYPNVAAALLSLPLKQQKYFFKAGVAQLHTDASNWSQRLIHLFDLVKQRGLTLSVHPHPHRFRHTFAADLLERGMDIRDVAEFMGDTVEVLMRHYAKYTKKQQEMSARKWRRAMTA